MCGIVGYIGKENPFPVLINGLSKLEYRGYDSAGVSRIENGQFEIYRAVGKLSNLRNNLLELNKLGQNENLTGALKIGIGHTRWATHGRPSEINAHPHVAGDICVVHNGIIENYIALRKELQAEGAVFTSETDTEIAAHLINRYIKKNPGDLFNAVKTAIAEIEGSYALVVISLKDPEKIVIAKNSTPVIIGVGSNGVNYVASDIPAILEHTRDVIILEDGDLAEVTAEKIYVEHNGKEIERKINRITWDAVTAEKGGFKHFMLKEIYEQPQVLAETFRGRINQTEGKIIFEDFNLSKEKLSKINKITISACGTAYYAGLITKFYLENYTRLPVEVDYASEFRYRDPVVDDKTLFLVISQSGETADSLGALNLANEHSAETVAITNVLGSSISRKSNNVIYTHAGPEISVASTKAFLTQVTCGLLLSLYIGEQLGKVTSEEIKKIGEDLVRLPSLVKNAIDKDKDIERIAKKFGSSQNFLFLGRGFLYPVALEGALKLKEISYAHAEGYPAGEMKHGPISLIDENTPVVVIVGHDGQNYEKTMSNLKEAESRGGKIITITDLPNEELRKSSAEIFELGNIPRALLPIVLTVPLQLFGYHVAALRGTDIDQPRNLAKSVTVE